MQVRSSEITDTDIRKFWEMALSSREIVATSQNLPAGTAPAGLVADFMERVLSGTPRERSSPSPRPSAAADESAISTRQWLAASPLTDSPFEQPTPESQRQPSATLEPESEVVPPRDGLAPDSGSEFTDLARMMPASSVEQMLAALVKDLEDKHRQEIDRLRKEHLQKTEKYRLATASTEQMVADLVKDMEEKHRQEIERRMEKHRLATADTEQMLADLVRDMEAKHKQEIEQLVRDKTSLSSEMRVLRAQVEPLKQAERLANERSQAREQELADLKQEQLMCEQIEEASAEKISQLSHELRSARGEVTLHQARVEELQEQLEQEQVRVFGDDEKRKAHQDREKKGQLLRRCDRKVVRTRVLAAWRAAVWESKKVRWKYRTLQDGLRMQNAVAAEAHSARQAAELHQEVLACEETEEASAQLILELQNQVLALRSTAADRVAEGAPEPDTEPHLKQSDIDDQLKAMEQASAIALQEASAAHASAAEMIEAAAQERQAAKETMADAQSEMVAAQNLKSQAELAMTSVETSRKQMLDLVKSESLNSGSADRDDSTAKSLAELARVEAELAAAQTELVTVHQSYDHAARKQEHTRETHLKHIVRRMQLSSAAAAFDRWHELYAHARRVKRRGGRQFIMAKVLRRMQVSAVAAALNQWQSFVRAKRSEKRIILHVLLRMQHTLQHVSFSRWLDFVRRCRTARKIVQRLINATLSEVWVRWVDYTQQCTRSHELDRVRQDAAKTVTTVTAEVEAQSIAQLESLAGLVQRRMRANLTATSFAFWYERTRSITQLARLHAEADEANRVHEKREEKLRKDTAEAKAAAKAAVVRLLNAAGTLSDPSAKRLVRLRLVGGSCAGPTLVSELVQLLQVPDARLRFVELHHHEQQDDLHAGARAATFDIEFLPASKKLPGPPSEKLVYKLAEGLGLGTHALFSKGLALPMVDRVHGVGTLSKSGELVFEYTTHSSLARLEMQLAREEAACEDMRVRYQTTSETLERRTAEVSAKRAEVEALQAGLTATREEVDRAGRVIEKARKHLGQRSTRTRQAICLRDTFSRWAVESRETIRCESAWVRGQLVSLESDLEKSGVVVEGLKGSLTLATEAAASSRAAHQAQLGRVREREAKLTRAEAKKGKRIEEVLLRCLDKDRGLKRFFLAWAAEHRAVRRAEYEKLVAQQGELVVQLSESTAAITNLQQAGAAAITNLQQEAGAAVGMDGDSSPSPAAAGSADA
jgi:hypothetical protein